MLEHGASPYSLSTAVRVYTELRLAVLPMEGAGRDPLDDAIRDLMRAETGHGPQP
jgi:hypothetical protein